MQPPAGADDDSALPIVEPAPGPAHSGGSPDGLGAGGSAAADHASGHGPAEPAGAATVDRRELALRLARERARRSWRRYAAGVGPFVLVVLVFVLLVWRTSEVRATHSHPTKTVAKALTPRNLPATLHQVWHTTDRSALGEPVYDDVAVTYSAHTVVGRDARTGRVRWSYERTDRTICWVVSEEGSVAALYRHDGNCDELTGLDAGSGRRLWVRTQFEDGDPFSTQTIPDFVLQLTPRYVHLMQPSSGADWWNVPQAAGCTTLDGVLGTKGVAWSTRCAGTTKLDFRLSSSKNSAWSVPLDGRTPLSADGPITVLSADRRSIQVLSQKTGKVTSTITMGAPVTAPVSPIAFPSATTSVEVIGVPGVFLGVDDAGAGRVLWARASSAPPANTTAGLLFASVDRVSIVNPTSGRASRVISAPGLPADSTLATLGGGLLTGDASGTTAWN